MKVLFIDSVHPILEQRLGELQFECEMDFNSNRTILLNKISNYQGLVVRSRTPIDKEFLDAAKQLKFIARSGAGLENIDLDEAQKKGIQLFSAPEGNMQAVGEHALGMLLNLFNNLSIADTEVRSGKWQREKNRGVELSGKTIGIIGYGNMGMSFAKCLAGFNCKVLAYDLHKNNYSNEFAKQASLEQIKAEAEIISFHTPYDQSTHYYLNEEFIAQMSKTFYVINTARGKVVKTSALVKGLESGKILGACLDVLEFEKSSFENMFDGQLPGDFKFLIESKKVLLSPHVAGWTQESYKKLSTVLANKIEAYFR